MSSKIPVMVSDMPSATDLLPYLQRIDAANVHANGGPLEVELEARVGRMIRPVEGGAPVAAVANGTVAIELALRALDLPMGAQVIVPAFTYQATGLAILRAGLRPVLADIDPNTWLMRPYEAHCAVDDVSKVGAVLPVATFGLPLDLDAWDRFSAMTGVPVVVDAAAALMTTRLPNHAPKGNLTVCFSLHATKIVGAGEGGLVAGSPDIVHRVRDLARFGQDGGTNAKLSEYHAAVALASLDQAVEKTRRLAEAEWYYVEGLARHAPPHNPAASWYGFSLRSPGMTTMCILLPEGVLAQRVADDMAALGIETRRWYYPFLHGRRDVCRMMPPPVLPKIRHCVEFGERMLGLPFHTRLTAADVDKVCAVLASSLSVGRS